MVILLIILVWRFKKRAFAGQNLALYLICYGVIRFSDQFLRDDEDFSVGYLSGWHLVAIGIFLLGITTHLILKRKNIPSNEYLRTKLPSTDTDKDKPEATTQPEGIEEKEDETE